jgi:hypothetical protein
MIWRRNKEKKDTGAGVYQYEELPQEFRTQVVHIWASAIGVFDKQYSRRGWVSGWRADLEPDVNRRWREICAATTRELGVFTLVERGGDDPFEQCAEYLLGADTKGALFIIEVTFRYIERELSGDMFFAHLIANQTGQQIPAVHPVVEELNRRFEQHGIGYQFVGGKLIRKDSGYVHKEAVEPAFRLLHDEQFSGAADEFLRAHERFKEGRYKEAIAEALKAFESTMKTICDLRRWPYSDRDTARGLIKIMLDNELIPSSLQNQFTSLQGLLESGLPTVRNKTSGHGQGKTPVNVPEYFAAYALNLAAANILFLVAAYKSSK